MKLRFIHIKIQLLWKVENMYNLKDENIVSGKTDFVDLEKILQIAKEFNMKEDECHCYNAIGLRHHKVGYYNDA